MIRASLLPALFLGATLAATGPAAANPLNNRAWWTAALQGMQTQASPSVAALPGAVPISLPAKMTPASPLAGSPGLASPGVPGAAIGADVCLGPIYRAERQYGIPAHLLRSIALTESGRWDDAAKRTVAWPWTINAEGVGHFFPTREAAIAAAKAFRARGIKSMDLGCMQINTMWHPGAFTSIEQAFDPEANVAYAAKYLSELKDERKTWTEAVGYYHSATPEHNQRYRAKISKTWAEIQRKPDSTQLASAAAAAAPKSFAAAPGAIGPTFISSDPSNARVAALSAAPRALSDGRRGMTLAQYRMAPTMPALDLAKGALLPR